MQIGWLDADSVIDQDGLDYLAIRDHLYQVGRSVLARLSNLDDMADDEREYFRDAHGLLASMTALLDRVGVGTTIQLRFPDCEAARTNENVRNDVVSFLANTAPKQSRYGAHSGWRQVESRPDKLKYRLPMDIDPTQRTADLTASWVVIGDGMDGLRDDVVAAPRRRGTRDAIQDGDEEGYRDRRAGPRWRDVRHAKAVVEDLISKKGWNTIRQDTDRVTRALMGVLSHAPGRVSPTIVADALLGMGTNEYGLDLRMGDVRAGLARVASEELFPTLAPSSGKLVRALVTADGRLEAGALADAAGIHRRTYATHMDTLETLDLVNRTDDGWGLTLEPWWAPEADRGALTRQPERWRPATRSFPTSPGAKRRCFGTGERAGVARRHRYIRCRPPSRPGRRPTDRRRADRGDPRTQQVGRADRRPLAVEYWRRYLTTP